MSDTELTLIFIGMAILFVVFFIAVDYMGRDYDDDDFDGFV